MNGINLYFVNKHLSSWPLLGLEGFIAIMNSSMVTENESASMVTENESASERSILAWHRQSIPEQFVPQIIFFAASVTACPRATLHL